MPIDSERSVVAVTDAYRTRLENYLASMLQAKRMLSMGIITPEDYAIIDTMQREEFGISSCSLYRGIDLIYDGFRGNLIFLRAGVFRRYRLIEVGIGFIERQPYGITRLD